MTHQEEYQEKNNNGGAGETVDNSLSPPNRLEPNGRWRLFTGILVIIILIMAGFMYWLIEFRQPAVETVYYADDQVIITGPLADVESVATAVEGQLDIQLIRVEPDAGEKEIPPFLAPTPSVEQIGSASRGTLQRPLRQEEPETNVFLYRVVDTKAEPTPLDQIVQTVRDQATGTDVASDPNYMIGSAPVEVEGDPDCTEGYTITESADLTGEMAKEMFYEQWAFNNSVGIGLYSGESQNGNEPPRTIDKIDSDIRGRNVIVAMFDTSPFDLRGDRVLDTEATEPVDFGDTAVNHFEVIGDPDARDHGVFGASLVDAIAPESEIRFYRVLNEDNRGDLFSLLRALESLRQSWDGQQPLVINLSLGVHPPEEEADAITTLETQLRDFGDANVVIVAAAGNDSSERSRNGEAPSDMQYPAAFPFVIGVGASNHSQGQSCYSNQADVFAPGGDNDDQCMPVVNQCDTDPTACLIGYVYTPPDAHYAYWNGTSFSAPMVSGLAALLLGEGVTASSEDVYAILAPNLAGGTVAAGTTDTDTAVDEAISIINVEAAVEKAQEMRGP